MTIVTNGSFSDFAGIDNEFYKLGCISRDFVRYYTCDRHGKNYWRQK